MVDLISKYCHRECSKDPKSNKCKECGQEIGNEPNTIPADHYVNDDFTELVDSETFTLDGTYGSNKTPTKIFVKELSDGSSWYVAQDSKNVNYSPKSLHKGQDIEDLEDTDMFTTSKPINSEDELENHVVEHYVYLHGLD